MPRAEAALRGSTIIRDRFNRVTEFHAKLPFPTGKSVADDARRTSFPSFWRVETRRRKAEPHHRANCSSSHPSRVICAAANRRCGQDFAVVPKTASIGPCSTIRPRSMMMTEGAKRRVTPRSWMMKSIPRCFSCINRQSKRRTPSSTSGARAEVTSSQISSSGSAAMQRATIRAGSARRAGRRGSARASCGAVPPLPSTPPDAGSAHRRTGFGISARGGSDRTDRVTWVQRDIKKRVNEPGAVPIIVAMVIRITLQDLARERQPPFDRSRQPGDRTGDHDHGADQ